METSPGAAAFDSDIEASALLNTADGYQDILYEAEIFQEHHNEE